MSNGEPVSGAPYIIICRSRAEIAAAKNTKERVLAACRGAAQLAAYMGIRYRVSMDDADMKPISDIQHELMDYLLETVQFSNAEADAKVNQMVAELYVLEKKYTGVAY